MERRQCRCHCHSFIRRNSLWVFSLSRSIDWLPHIIVNFMLKRKTICFLFSLSPSFARRWKWRICRIEDWVEERNGFSITNIKYCVSIYPFFQIAFQFFLCPLFSSVYALWQGGEKDHINWPSDNFDKRNQYFIDDIYYNRIHNSTERWTTTIHCAMWWLIWK